MKKREYVRVVVGLFWLALCLWVVNGPMAGCGPKVTPNDGGGQADAGPKDDGGKKDTAALTDTAPADKVGPTDTARVDTAPVDKGGNGQVTYGESIKPLWSKYGCDGCHGSAGGLSLGADAYKNIVNATAKSGKTLVVPGDTAGSYLYEKITKDKPEAGARMPLGKIMSDGDIKLIETWIKAGAKDD